MVERIKRVRAKNKEQAAEFDVDGGAYEHILNTFYERTDIDVEAARKHLWRKEADLRDSGKMTAHDERSLEFAHFALVSMQQKDVNGFEAVDPRTGRVFYPATSFPRELRQFLRIDGEPIVEVDIVAAQPLFLCLLYGDSPDDLKERRKYLDWCRNDFYSRLMVAANDGWEGESPEVAGRSAAKLSLYVEIFFAREDRHYPRAFRAAFRRHFPLLFRKLVDLKTPDHTQAALFLQSVEAEIVVKDACASLARAGVPVLSLHDGVLCKRGDAERVRREIVRAVCAKLGVEETDFAVSIKDPSRHGKPKPPEEVPYVFADAVMRGEEVAA